MWELYYCASFNKYKELKIVLQKWFLIENYFFDKRDIFMEWEFFGETNKQTNNKQMNKPQAEPALFRKDWSSKISFWNTYIFNQKKIVCTQRYIYAHVHMIYLFIYSFWLFGGGVEKEWLMFGSLSSDFSLNSVLQFFNVLLSWDYKCYCIALSTLINNIYIYTYLYVCIYIYIFVHA